MSGSRVRYDCQLLTVTRMPSLPTCLYQVDGYSVEEWLHVTGGRQDTLTADIHAIKTGTQVVECDCWSSRYPHCRHTSVGGMGGTRAHKGRITIALCGSSLMLLTFARLPSPSAWSQSWRC